MVTDCITCCQNDSGFLQPGLIFKWRFDGFLLNKMACVLIGRLNEEVRCRQFESCHWLSFPHFPDFTQSIRAGDEDVQGETAGECRVSAAAAGLSDSTVGCNAAGLYLNTAEQLKSYLVICTVKD